MHDPLTTPVGVSKNKLWEYYKEFRDAMPGGNGVASTKAVEEAQTLANALAIAETLDPDTVEKSFLSLVQIVRDTKDKLDALNLAIEDKQKQLKEVHGFEATANGAVALVEAKKKLIEEAEAKAAEIVAKAKEESEAVKDAAFSDAAQMRTEAAEEAVVTKRDQERQKEQWEYSFARQKKEKVDEVQDKINLKAKGIQEREDSVAEREAAAKAKDEEIATLEAEITELNNSIAKKISNAEGKARGMAEKDAKNARDILEAQHEGTINALQATKSSLMVQLEEAKRRINALEMQVGSANERVTDIATNALKAGADAATITEVAKTVAAGGHGKK